METQQMMELLRDQAIRALRKPKDPKPHELQLVLEKVLRTMKEVDKLVASFNDTLAQLGEEDAVTGPAPCLYYDGERLIKTGVSGETGRRWVIQVPDKDIEAVVVHLGAPGECVRSKVLKKATGIPDQKLYVVLAALEIIGLVDHGGVGVWVKTAMSVMHLWEKLEKLPRPKELGGTNAKKS